MPHWVYTLVPFGFEAAGVVLLYSVLHALESQESSLLFNTLQAVLILIPPITQACIVSKYSPSFDQTLNADYIRFFGLDL